jgi:iron complex outermembrane receptor protein
MLTIPTTAVTGNPLGVGSDQMVVPISILNGRELSLKRESTLAETLNSVPGVSNSSFGPSVGRPMIRGMDSDRIRILQNGVNSIDASNLSFDHAVAIDPLIIEQIDVIRGPATLLYGGGAVGGVVNAIDHRIPKEKLQGITGRGEIRYGGANLEQSQAAVIDVGTGNFVMHLDAYHRDGKNYRIPGNAVSNRLQSTQTWDPEGGRTGLTTDDEEELKEGAYSSYSTDHGRRRLLNSQSETKGGAIGASMIFDKGFVGFSYAKHQSVYGSVKEPGVHLDMDRDRYDFSSELKDLNTFFDRAKFKVAYTDYQHHEKEGGEIHTTFKNAVTDGTFELGHKPLAGLQGVLGMQFDHGKFNAIGHEAFVPNSRTNSQSVYIYEELPLDQHKVTFGLRHGKHDVENKGGESDHGNHFSDPTTKKFNTNNAAIGGLYALNDQWSLTGNISHNERAPTYFELFANGLHKATGVYEEGQADLKKEKSNGIDGQIRWKSGQDSLTFGAYFNRFSNFIGLLSTNDEKEVHHEHDDDEHYITYKKSRFTGIRAEFKGIELEGKTMLTDYLQFNLRADYVDAKDKTNGGYVPRISPLKLGAGLKYEFDTFGVRLDVLHAFRQDRVATNYNYEGTKELITDGYTNVSMMATYKLPTQYNIEVFTRANNLLDEEIREHASFLKDIAPMGGRSLMVGLRGEF